MSKTLKIVFIVLVLLLALAIMGIGVVSIGIGDASDLEEYKIDKDIIKSIKAVVARREVTSMTNEKKNEVTIKKMKYKSADVKEDLEKYIEYLTDEADFVLTQDMNLEETPSTIELSKSSIDEGKIIRMTIEYDSFGYTINIQKGKKFL